LIFAEGRCCKRGIASLFVGRSELNRDKGTEKLWRTIG